MRKALLILFIMVATVAGFWLKKGRVSLTSLQQKTSQSAPIVNHTAANSTEEDTDTIFAENCSDMVEKDMDSTFIAQLINVEVNKLSEGDKMRLNVLAPLFEDLMPISQFFVANTDKVIILKGKNGTKLTIPKQAFNNNNKAATGEIHIELKELYGVSGLLLANLPTLSDRGVLAAEGTFYLNATTTDGQVLKINKGITVEIPTTRKENNCGLFYGNQATNGDWEWIASSDNNRDYNEDDQKETETPDTQAESVGVMLYGAPSQAICWSINYCLHTAEKLGIDTETISQYINLFQQSSYNWWGIDNTSTETAPSGDGSLLNNYPTEAAPMRKCKPRMASVGNTFVATQMGWISINRHQSFYSVKKHLTAHINAPQNTKVSTFLVLKNMSIVIPATRNAEGNYVFDKVPRGIKGYLVAMTYKQNQPYVDILAINTGENPIETLTLRPTTVDQLKYQVMQLK